MDDESMETASTPAWVPPVIRELPEEEKPAPASDIFFAQYVVCILLLTVLLMLRVYDEGAYAAAAETFRSRTAAPSAEWAVQLLRTVQGLWS